MNDKNDELSFKVYLNYVSTISEYLNKNGLKNIQKMTISQTFKTLRTQKELNIVYIKKILRNAWLTEQQILQASIDESYIYIANHWICVQVYYSIYLMLRVLHLALRKEIKDSHTGIIKETNQEIKQRKIFPDPWSLLCIEDGEESKCYLGLEKSSDISHGRSVLKKNYFLNTFTQLLKTTRQKLLKKQYEEQRKKIKKKKLSKKQKEDVNKHLYPTSIFDFLYRIRVRCNYEDADMFFFSGDKKKLALEFNTGVKNILYYTLLLLETIIAQCISAEKYQNIINDFQKEYTKGTHTQVNLGSINRWEQIHEFRRV
jgi:hypothetical protein